VEIIRHPPEECFDNPKLFAQRRGGANKTSFKCPVCSRKTAFSWKNLENAHAALNQRSAFEKEIKEVFDTAFPVQRIESNVLGRRMPIFLEYALDFHCAGCGTPCRILFSLIETKQGESYYMIKSLLALEKATSE
jgi:hypothetical protein